MPPVTDPVTAPPSSESLEKPTILIVDDSRLMRHALKKILSADFTLVEAVDGEEAWVKLQTEPSIQAIFSDLSMPNLDGYGLLERVRNAGEAGICSLPFIVITGKEGDVTDLREEAQMRGANEIVCKPFRSDEIVAMTKTFLASGERNDTESEAQRQAEETARLAAEAEARRIAEEAEIQRQAEEAARLAAESEARRIAEEAEAQRQAEEAARQAAEAEARRIAEEAEAQRQAAESARLAAEAEARRIAEGAEIQRQAEENARLAAEAEARRLAEEAEAQRQAEESARLAAEAEARRLTEEAEAQRQVQEAARLAAVVEARAAEEPAPQPGPQEPPAIEAPESARPTAEQAANADESQCVSEAGAEAASSVEQSDEQGGITYPAAAESPRLPPLVSFCIRLALPLLYIGNRLLGLQKDKQLAALRKRLR